MTTINKPLFWAIILSASILIGGFVMTACSIIQDQYRRTHSYALILEIGEGWCSGTVVGKHTILTAQHCFDDPMWLLRGMPLKVYGKDVKIVGSVGDGADHLLLELDMEFSSMASIDPEPVDIGTPVYMHGNPVPHKDIFRRGYVSGHTETPDGTRVTLYDINGTFGDSGAGIFNEKGQVTGVISLIVIGPEMKLMASLPMKFTKQQLREIK